jgi:dTDP-4-dehydrorhamnose reductase
MSGVGRILVIGRDGQVGHELARALAPLGEVTALGRAEMDLEREDSIRETVRSLRPRWIVNAAAYTAVDKAESEPKRARTVNARAVAVLAEEAKAVGASVIHYSTDYVFDGEKPAPYIEDDAANPRNIYGQTKLEGEWLLAATGVAYLVLRTSWVYGSRGKNFLRTILKLAAEKPELRIVDDQIGAPTAAREIAAATAVVLRRWAGTNAKPTGIYHLTASGETSWHGFAAAAIDGLRSCRPEINWARLIPISTAEYPTPAARPKNSRLDCDKLERDFGVRLPDWKQSLAKVLEEMQPVEPTGQVQGIR